VYDGPVIDADIHYTPESQADVYRHLPAEWQEYASLPGGGRVVPPGGSTISVTEQPDGVNRFDSYPDDGTPPGSSYELLCEQLLDVFDIRAGMLTQAAGPSTPNGGFAAAVCSAMNDWLVERWLDGKQDPRLYGALLVPTRDPALGAEEIRRAGAHPKWAAAMLTYSIGQPYGHTVYDPIYEAATELDLPVYIHGSTGEIVGGSAPPQSGGAVLHYRLEMFATLHHPMAHHLTSMIVHGTFERFPRLRLVVAELGIAWLPWLMTTLDANYELMRRESKWVRRRPSEYLRERVAFSTQPIESTVPDRDRLVDQLSTVDGIDDILCFSSDYPHWDGDEPSFISSILPAEWHDKVFYGNARRLLRLPASIPRTAPAGAAAR
jgi:predicted TIM-barrel fold metal-dependent hydrolase